MENFENKTTANKTAGRNAKINRFELNNNYENHLNIVAQIKIYLLDRKFNYML
jgi:hypothetical protein